LIYLLFSILASTFIFIAFKLFERFKVNVFQSIVVNYFVAGTTGLLFYEKTVELSQLPNYDWFYYTIALGALFIIIFNLMALTTQIGGLSVVSVATKMSVVIPILFGLLYYKESIGFLKIIGIVLALIAVYFASVKSNDALKMDKKYLMLPILVFIGSGIIDTSLKYLEGSFVAQNDVPLFSSTIFFAAGCIGLLVLLYQAITKKVRFSYKNIIGGIALGVPNYFSIYFLVKALRSGLMDSSGIFTVNNVAIVALSTLVGILLFNEKLRAKNWLGIILALVSIILIALSN